MKKLLALLPLIFIIACKPMIKLVFNVRDVKHIESRVVADSLNKRILDKFDIDYIMLYRTDYYLKQTHDTTFWSGNVRYFSSNHLMYNQHTNYCPSSTTRDIHPDSLYLIVKVGESDSVETIDNDLVGLEYLSGNDFVLDSIKLRKYNVILNFNTWWRGPEKRQIRRISKALPKDSTLYLLINKDYILEDDLELYDFVKKDSNRVK